MDQELKTKWLAALRSGDYKQVNGALESIIWGDEVGYCCLGVLSKIATGDAEGWIRSDGSDLLEANQCGIPEKIQDRLACMNDGGYDPDDGEVKLSKHNFTEIADWIEENL